jgi:hypothetical protein
MTHFIRIYRGFIGFSGSTNEGLSPDGFRRSGRLTNMSRQETQLNDGLSDRTTARQSCPRRPSNPYIQVANQRRQPASSAIVGAEAGTAPKVQCSVKNGSLEVAQMRKMRDNATL